MHKFFILLLPLTLLLAACKQPSGGGDDSNEGYVRLTFQGGATKEYNIGVTGGDVTAKENSGMLQVSALTSSGEFVLLSAFDNDSNGSVDSLIIVCSSSPATILTDFSRYTLASASGTFASADGQTLSIDHSLSALQPATTAGSYDPGDLTRVQVSAVRVD